MGARVVGRKVLLLNVGLTDVLMLNAGMTDVLMLNAGLPDVLMFNAGLPDVLILNAGMHGVNPTQGTSSIPVRYSSSSIPKIRIIELKYVFL